ncbi:MAG: nicotinate-nucleotide adenylyltransferase [Deltaproteobacteria bacterium]
MRTAIMGGTFDPIHYGHLRISEEVREAFSFPSVVFTPAFVPPHKHGEAVTDAAHRFKMTELAISGNAAFSASDMELKRGGRSFTIDTVRETLEAGCAEISLIIGSDSFNDITTWCEYEDLLNLCSLIIIERPGSPMKKPAEALPVELAKKFWYDASGIKGGAGGGQPPRYTNASGKSITYFQTTPFGISSSDIRRRIAGQLSVRYLLPERVIEYIRTHGLYKT